MTIAEAVQLVIEAGALGEGGEVFLLNIGEPVRILDLAYDKIRLSGLEPNVDVPIVFTGPCPGEKLFEELRTDGEDVLPTRHPQIVKLRGLEVDEQWLEEGLRRLEEAVSAGGGERAKKVLLWLAQVASCADPLVSPSAGQQRLGAAMSPGDHQDRLH